MKTKKQHLRHHILNLFTIMGYRMNEEEKDEENTAETKKLLKMATCFVEHEEIFLGNKPSFFKQDSSLKETVNMLHAIHHEAPQNRVKEVTLPEKDIQLPLDQYYVGEALGYMIEQLYQHAQQVSYDIEPATKSLTIKHDSDILLPSDPEDDWVDKKNDYLKVSLWLAQAILKEFGVEVTSKKGEIGLSFP